MSNNVKIGDPIGQTIYDAIWSYEGTAAMLAAVANGRPALEAIDPRLVELLGTNYGKHNEATIQAGYLVTKRMKELGYTKSKQVKLEAACVARSAVLFTKDIL
ncbi:MAG: hypothetical protein JWR75_701 [Devosia sp.]|nr:hypothetical protein [Devosia sp.]